MLINQSKQVLQYCQQSPIRLLSLPSQQTEMVKRLKLSKCNRNWYPDQSHRIADSSQNRSLRLQKEIRDSVLLQNQISPQSKSLEISPTIHSRQRKNMPSWKQIYKKNRYSVFKHFMRQDAFSSKDKTNQDLLAHEFQVSKLLKISNKPLFQDKNLPQIYRNHIKRSKKEKQLRKMLVLDRINHSPKLNNVVRKLVSSNRIISL